MTRIDEFDYELPPQQIAQTPLENRAASKLLVDRGSSVPEHCHVDDLDTMLSPGDLIVVNNTRVLKARLFMTRPTGGVTELLLLEPEGPPAVALALPVSHWTGLVKPSKKVAPGTELVIAGESDLVVTVHDDLGEGRRKLTIESSDLESALVRVGEMPLPPYITETLEDSSRYQTVYADELGSAAAPTAGLHLTKDLLGRLEANGVGLATVELVVGLDTFRPVMVEELDDHHMHSERFAVPVETAEKIASAKQVIAIGTTTVRALESWAQFGDAGSTNLFIRKPFEFQVVDMLLTNFHMPKSTLLVMIDAFIGSRWANLYDEALNNDYRFLSFGDAMLLDRSAT